MSIPRIRARSGKGEDNKFYFEISIWNFAGTQQVGDVIGPFGPWETEEICKAEMRRAVEIGVKGIKGPDGQEPEGMIDMLDKGTFKKFYSEQN